MSDPINEWLTREQRVRPLPGEAVLDGVPLPEAPDDGDPWDEDQGARIIPIRRPVDRAAAVAPDLVAVRELPLWASCERAAATRRVSPLAVLGAVLARAGAFRSPGIRADAGLGPLSLNFGVVLLGPPGSGKSSTIAAAEAVLPAGLDPDAHHEGGIASGEGIPESYYGTKKETVEGPNGKPRTEYVRAITRWNTLLVTDEAGGLLAQAARPGSTLLPELRSALHGQGLGSMAATAERRRPVPGGTYAFGALVGLQPATAGPLVDDHGAGTPQRFLWLPTVWAPDLPDPDGMPPAIRAGDHHGLVIGYPDHVSRAARDAADRGRTGTRTAEETGREHELRLQLVTAALLAHLDGERAVTDQHWAAAGELVAVSRCCLEELAVRRREQDAARNRARGRAEGERLVVAEATADEERVATAIAWLLKHLPTDPTDAVAGAELARRLPKSCRDSRDEALRRLTGTGQAVEQVAKQGGVKYHR